MLSGRHPRALISHRSFLIALIEIFGVKLTAPFNCRPIDAVRAEYRLVITNGPIFHVLLRHSTSPALRTKRRLFPTVE